MPTHLVGILPFSSTSDFPPESQRRFLIAYTLVSEVKGPSKESDKNGLQSRATCSRTPVSADGTTERLGAGTVKAIDIYATVPTEGVGELDLRSLPGTTVWQSDNTGELILIV
jgi:hypothetical protein